MNIDNQLIVIKTPKNNKFLAVIDIDKEFTTNEGKFKFSQIKNIPSIVETSTGINFKIYKPSYKEFVLLMKRGPQIIYPKDVAQIVKKTEFYKNNQSILFKLNDDKYLFDLPLLIKESLISSRINNFGNVDIDTYKKSNLFFSHRKSSHKNFPKQGKTGRHISVIGLIS